MTKQQLVKKCIDLSAAILLLVVLAPLFAVIALLILVLEGRPVFYVSKRQVGPKRSIPVLKFRTMVRDALSPKYRLRERFMRGGYLDIPRNCEVYTPIGRILERAQIVELPQLLNILLHGMSLIGNRPLPSENVRCLSQFDGWQERFGSPAGISGIAQIVGKLNLEPEDRLALEAAYSEVYQHGNLILCDLLIVWYTLETILRGTSTSLEMAISILNRTTAHGRFKLRIKSAV